MEQLTVNEGELIQKIDLISQDVNSLYAQYKDLVIDSDETEALGIEVLGAFAKRDKRIKEVETGLTKPMKDHVKHIEGMFKPLYAIPKEFSELMRPRLAAYHNLKQQKAREEMEAKIKEQKEAQARIDQAKKEAEAAGQPLPEMKTTMIDVIEEVPEVKASVKTASSTMSYTQRWTYKVDDMAVLMAAHPELFELSGVKVNALIRSGVREVKGMTIFQETVPSIRVK